MAITKYTYSITNNTANSKLAADALKSEIDSSSIVIGLSYISSLGDVLDIYMKDSLSTEEETTLDSIVSAHTGVSLAGETSLVEVETTSPFASKKIWVNGVQKSLFKRVHGVSKSIAAGATENIDFIVPYTLCKFTGAEIFNTTVGDTLNFTVHDDTNNTYSGAPTTSPGYPNYQLNQFGFSVCMPNDRYKNTSNYDADIYGNMIIRCAYTNNTGSTKTVSMNVWLHQVV